MADHGSGNIKVVVRCRPLNSRELTRGAKNLIQMSNNQTILDAPEIAPGTMSRSIEKTAKTFTFDKSYWSAGPRDDPAYASQQTLYDDLGKELLEHSFQGFNCCIFAYGQTGSGKSYSMMGYGADKGIIPLTCSALFDNIKEKSSTTQKYTVEVSFYEIYNEKIRDLLNPKNKSNLRVREHPSTGPYVEDLAKLAVESYEDIERLMDEGNKARTVAATNMNETSSRSHSVFTVLVTQKKLDEETGMEGEKVSRINLVDLAGSERANSTGATGSRLKEGANINKSLTTLGKVISALAQASSHSIGTPRGKKSKEDFIPYRDSSLTWLLKDSIGGNSKTCMIAAISPADYEETLSTLRYADQAKKIKNRAVVNEDPNAKLIRELKEELVNLRNRLSGGSAEATFDPDVPPEKQIVQYRTSAGEIKSVSKAELADQIEQSEKLMKEVNQTWEEKLVKTQEIQKARESALEELGIVIEKNLVGVHTPRKMPHLVNLNEDPLASECLLFCIKRGKTTVGNSESAHPLDIRLSGPAIKDEHCYFEHPDDLSDSSVTITSLEGATTMVNGRRLSPGQPKLLKSGYRIIMGDFHVFRFNNPEEVRQARDKIKDSIVNGSSNLAGEAMTPPHTRPDSPYSSATVDGADWAYARREAIYARLNGSDVDLDKINDEDLDKLYSDISRARTMRKGVSRSESRLSFMESVDEEQDEYNEKDDDNTSTTTTTDPSIRPFSGSTWASENPSLESTLVNGGGAALQAKEEFEAQLVAQKVEYEEKLKKISENNDTKEELQAQLQTFQKDMQKKLDSQKRKYERKVRRLATDKKINPDDWSDGEEPLVLNERELYLVRKILAKWKSLASIALSERILAQAVLCKEANVISRELSKRVTYQFILIGRPPYSTITTSSVESIAGLSDIDDVEDVHLVNSYRTGPKPILAIKVLDFKHRSAYVWSTEKLLARLSIMRNLYTFIDRPSYSEHLNWEDPFYDTPSPMFSLIGYAPVVLTPLLFDRKNLSIVEYRAPIFATFLEDTHGSCRIRLRNFQLVHPPPSTPRALTSRGASEKEHNEDETVIGLENGNHIDKDESDVANGSKLSFELVVDQVTGLPIHALSSVHLQIRLSRFTGDDIASSNNNIAAGSSSLAPTDETFSSNVIDINAKSNDNLSSLRLRRTITLDINDQVKKHIKESFGTVEIFGRTDSAYLQIVQDWDSSKNSRQLSSASGSGRSDEQRKDDADIVRGRLAESEMVTEQHHDVRAAFVITELGADGQYSPVDLVAINHVDRGAFNLHQGLQRRITVKLTHNSGRQWPWSKISSVAIGNVRLLDSRGIVHEPQSDEPPVVLVPKAKSATCVFKPDGTSVLSFEAAWDSSTHDSPFLNRMTPSGSRILLSVTYNVEANNCEGPIPFTMDVAVVMQEREKTTSSLKRFLSQSRVLKQASALFAVSLTPSRARKMSEIWRRDTSKSFIRGEENLGNWTPRGISLVTQRIEMSDRVRRFVDVQTMKMALRNMGISEYVEVASQSSAGENEERLRDYVERWKQYITSRKRIAPPEGPIMSSSSSSATTTTTTTPDTASLKSSKSPRDKRLRATVEMIPFVNNVQCRGYLEMLRDPTSDKWVRRWFVLNRPYLYIYDNSEESQDVGVVNVSSVKVDRNEELEAMLERKYVFAVFTQQNAYFFQADTDATLQKWLLAIDPAYRP